MKNTSIILLVLLLFSCGKENAKQQVIAEENTSKPPYDTVAIDSFSPGATTVDIARRIKISSIKYQDSLKQLKLKTEEEQLLKKAKEEKLALEKKVEETQKKAKADLDKAKEKSQNASPKTEPVINP